MTKRPSEYAELDERLDRLLSRWRLLGGGTVMLAIVVVALLGGDNGVWHAVIFSWVAALVWYVMYARARNKLYREFAARRLRDGDAGRE
jgi:hypothetical protein